MPSVLCHCQALAGTSDMQKYNFGGFAGFYGCVHYIDIHCKIKLRSIFIYAVIVMKICEK